MSMGVPAEKGYLSMCFFCVGVVMVVCVCVVFVVL